MKKYKKIQNKIVNFLVTKGKKAVNEKNLIKGLKKLQKFSKKSTKNIIKTTIVSAATPFKILTFKQKKRKKKKIKEIPFFLKTHEERIVFAIKNFTKSSKSRQYLKLYKNVHEELIQTIQQKKQFTGFKQETQKKIIQNKKRLLINYKW